MILQSIDFNIAGLLHSDETVAVCELEAEKLKGMILTIRAKGWKVIVVETPDQEHFLVFSDGGGHHGDLVGDVRRWERESGYQFFLKLPHEELATPRPDAFVLPDGREVEIRNVLTHASNFTHWGLIHQEGLPDGYVRL